MSFQKRGFWDNYYPVPNQSLSFASASSRYLSMNGTSFGTYDSAKFTFATAFKKASDGASMAIAARNSLSFEWDIQINASNKLAIRYACAGTTGSLVTTATYTGTTARTMVVHFDQANATAGDRMRLWVDDVEITAFDTDTNPTGAAPGYNTNTEISIGGAPATFGYFNGNLEMPCMFSGVLVPATSIFLAGKAQDVHGIAGLKMLLNTNDFDALIDDAANANNFTNNNSVAKAASIL